MRVHQPGHHLTQERGVKVDDWSWARTARRIAMLARLTRPYRRRTAAAVVFVVAAPAASLTLPYLAKLAIDRAIRPGDVSALGWIVAAFVLAAVGVFAFFWPVLTAEPITYDAWRQRMWLEGWI